MPENSGATDQKNYLMGLRAQRFYMEVAIFSLKLA